MVSEKADEALKKCLVETEKPEPVSVVLVLEADHEGGEEANQQLPAPSEFPSRKLWRQHLRERAQSTTVRRPELYARIDALGVKIRGKPFGKMLTAEGTRPAVIKVLEMPEIKAALLDREMSVGEAIEAEDED